MVTHAVSLWCETALGDCCSKVCEYHSLCLCVPVFHMRSNNIDWNHWGEWVCVYRQIRPVDWPQGQLIWVPGAANINTSGKTHTHTFCRWKQQMDSHLHLILIIKLTHRSCDSQCEHGKCQFIYTEFILLKAIVAECKGSESSHIKGLMPSVWKIMIKVPPAISKMLFYWLIRTESNYWAPLSILICPVQWVRERVNWDLLNQPFSSTVYIVKTLFPSWGVILAMQH